MTARSYKLPLLRVQTANKANTSCLPTIAKVLKNPYINKACRMLKLGHHTSGDFLYYLEVDESFHSEVLALGGKNVYLDGYFQSPHYFESYRKELLTQLQPNYLPADSYMAQLAQIKSSCSVAVHVVAATLKQIAVRSITFWRQTTTVKHWPTCAQNCLFPSFFGLQMISNG